MRRSSFYCRDRRKKRDSNGSRDNSDEIPRRPSPRAAKHLSKANVPALHPRGVDMADEEPCHDRPRPRQMRPLCEAFRHAMARENDVLLFDHEAKQQIGDMIGKAQQGASEFGCLRRKAWVFCRLWLHEAIGDVAITCRRPPRS